MIKKFVVAMVLGMSLLVGGNISGVTNTQTAEATRVSNIVYDNSSIYIINNDNDNFDFNVIITVDGRGTRTAHYRWSFGNDWFTEWNDNYSASTFSIYGSGSMKDVFRRIFYAYRGYSAT